MPTTCDIPQPRPAPAPFDKPTGDIVLHTSDGVLFRVFRWILEDSSPVFSTIFALPQPHPSMTTTHAFAESDGADSEIRTAIIAIEEPSHILDVLLRLCYPFPERPSIASFDEAKPLFVAAHKYEMSRIVPVLIEAATLHLKADPLRAYAFAVRLRMDALARAAAREYISTDVTTYPPIEELEDITAGDYQRLLAYRQECVVALSSLNARWVPDGTSESRWRWRTCYSCKPGKSISGWYQEHWNRIAAILRTAPGSDAIKSLERIDETVYVIECDKCRRCKPSAWKNLLELSELLFEEIQKRLAMVTLQLK
ncbi:hypothetical protein C8Q74DRAFT_566544 [Fomes fomentarius]|nr:hypothetical protein C8Q74DRAFT_566544 [Fomes fomentarius]